LNVDPENKPPLRPFSSGTELLRGSIRVLQQLRPDLGEMLREMDRMGHLDLESRFGKAPGGYNYPLYETGVPFIFMNAVGLQNDLTTMVHEAGHAIHAFLTNALPLSFHKETPSEVAELASMSMELISMPYWDVFYHDPDTLRRARQHQVERSITGLPWIATVDAFQLWLYDHPAHTREERAQAWVDTYRRFHGDTVNWAGWEDVRAYLWQRQLHIYEVPFYYIEYGFAQLGAFQVWRNVLANRDVGIEGYLAALRLGYSQPVANVYAAASARFDLDAAGWQELFQFVWAQYRALA
jgi:oligoendopeptidase F